MDRHSNRITHTGRAHSDSTSIPDPQSIVIAWELTRPDLSDLQPGEDDDFNQTKQSE